MIVLLAELFLDGRLSIRPERSYSLAESLSRNRGADQPEELWTPWGVTERSGGLRVRQIPPDRLADFLASNAIGICLLGDGSWNRMALESGRIEEIWIRWLPQFGGGDEEPFVSEFQPAAGARLPLRLVQWRREEEGGIIGYYAVLPKEATKGNENGSRNPYSFRRV
ncbi:hypothetical protein MAMC_00346 [Methylacidimicrobium cyclopophantes]|uniref:Bacterial bifunctional deaminase-reductase C-terminal domain-containing protein n=1 Tax=Methylacidimicrobium cyclopophantes TaxID=1041766 RepID=A0A5E6MB44_9BACT|nr:hypothetical protein [Methylacidimicrobium cyclopophantes]VVM04975.1 hypothetical protein MAMC_00346 [Methylacidimicrobium cyclopophantes]